MANTYSKIYVQFVFAVRNRESLILPDWKYELYSYITGIVKQNNHKLIAINGMPDHLHVFIGYKPHQSIPELLQDIKASSARWINRQGLTKSKFIWQEGYGAFSYSQSHIDIVTKYILNQELHHKKMTFKEEYVSLLRKFDIEYDVKYILKDIGSY